MNNIYKIVFNQTTQTYTAVSELAKGATKTQSQSAKQAGTFLPKFAKITLAISMVLGFGASVMAAGVVVAGNGTATGDSSVSLGYVTKALGTYSVAMGEGTEARGKDSTTMGYYTIAEGSHSVAMGEKTKAIGKDSIAMGYHTIAGGINSTAMGDQTIALEHNSIAMGYKSEAKGIGSFAVGGVLGEKTGGIAYTAGSMALGTGTVAGVEGGNQEAVAMGYRAKATGDKSMALGFDSEATGAGSLATGKMTIASGHFSTAMGRKTKALGSASTALGSGSYALGSGSFAIGKEVEESSFEIESLLREGKYDDIVAHAEYKDAFTDEDKATLAGFTETEDKEKFIILKVAENKGNFGAVAYGEASRAMGMAAISSGKYSSAIGNRTKSSGEYSTAMGYRTTASGNYSTALGVRSKASGRASTALGVDAEASGIYSIALGYNTTASNLSGTAIGFGAKTKGIMGTSLGAATLSDGNLSTAMGYRSRAVGIGSLAMGGFKEKRVDELVKIKDFETLKTEYSDVFTPDIVAEFDLLATDSEKTNYVYNIMAVKGQNQGGQAYSDASIAIGKGTVAGTVIIDDNGTPYKYDDNIYTAGKEEAVAMGYRAKAVADKTLALGFDAKAEHTNSVALGSKAETRDFTQVDGTKAINGLKYKEFSGFADGVVSVGKTAHEKQIINVAPGKISQESTDAINGSQLYATTIVLGNVATSVKDNLGGNAAIDENGNITFTDIGGTGKGTIHDAIGDVKTALGTKLEASDIQNITSSDQSVVIGANKNVATGQVDLKVNVDNSTLEVANGEVSVKDGGISTGKLADGAVTESKLVDDAVTEAKIADALLTELKAKSREKVKAGDGIKVSPDTVAADTDNQAFTVSLSDAVKAKLDNLADNANDSYLDKLGSNVGNKVTFGGNVGTATLADTTELAQIKAVKAVDDKVTANATALGNKANVDLSNLTAAGTTVIKDTARGAVEVAVNPANDGILTLAKATANNKDTYTLSIDDTKLNDKVGETFAKKDASNLTDPADVGKWKKKLGIDGLATNANIVSKLEADDIISTDKTVGIDTATTAGKVDLKVNLDGTTLTKDGNGVISLADNAVTTAKILDGNVTKAKLAGDVTDILDKVGTGAVADGNTNTVTGDVVKTYVDTATAGKLDKGDLNVIESDDITVSNAGDLTKGNVKLSLKADKVKELAGTTDLATTYLNVSGANVGDKATFGGNVGTATLANTTELAQIKAVKAVDDKVAGNTQTITNLGNQITNLGDTITNVGKTSKEEVAIVKDSGLTLAKTAATANKGAVYTLGLDAAKVKEVAGTTDLAADLAKKANTDASNLTDPADVGKWKEKLGIDGLATNANIASKLEADDIISTDKTVGIDTATTAGKVDLKVNLDGTTLTKDGSGVISLADNAVTTAKILDGNVTKVKLAGDVTDILDKVGTGAVADGNTNTVTGDVVKTYVDTATAGK
ncbi:ESPR-type extended signal peptide-containing protein, partial [Pasteurella skyensis]|uniref:ESPR-type extended signal peptide-containing protein n=1 Tax=Phocoenobacter skyensis TaxID=97481 RepID=UPI00279491FE